MAPQEDQEELGLVDLEASLVLVGDLGFHPEGVEAVLNLVEEEDLLAQGER